MNRTARRYAADTLQTTPADLVLAAFAAYPNSTVIIDQDGVITAANEAWRNFGPLNGATVTADVGDSYLEACDRAAAAGDDIAAQAALEIRNILAQGSGTSSVVYPCHSPECRRWFEAQAVAFPMVDGNFVLIIHAEITAEWQAREALSTSERRLRAVLDAMPVGLWIMDAAGRVVHRNPAGDRIWAGERLGPNQLDVYKGWWISTGEPIAPGEWASDRALRNGETSIDEEIEIECFDGTRKFILNSALPLLGTDGAIEGAIVVNLDITNAKMAAAELRQGEQRWRALFDLLPVGASVLNSRNRIVEHNLALERILGLTREEIEDGMFRDWRFFGNDGGVLSEDRFPSVRARRTNRPIDAVEITIEREDGSRIETSVSAAALPQPAGSVVIVTNDITAQVRAREAERRAKAELEKALLEQTEHARTDFLTQVWNRRHFFELATHELALATRHQQALSVVLLDIDSFKAINDRYGHEVGDEVLQHVAQAMKTALRDTDILARHGGEEFVVLLPFTDSPAAGLVAENLRAAASGFRVENEARITEVTISAGVAAARRGDSVDSLVSRADHAMYTAKSTGRNRVVVAPDEDDEGEQLGPSTAP
ncbi:MAG: diguanylate cyclase [Thermoanaerobaculia bacterium]|nr:diguanylate cyclase [Thermoanaerobaculia bacterium]